MLLLPQAARPSDFSDSFRRAIVRSAQIADQLDSAWQQVAGEVVPAWQQPQSLSVANVPPLFVDEAFATDTLALALEAGAECAGVKASSLAARLPAARQETVLLYQTGASRRPLFNEPFYADGAASAAPVPGTAVRLFPAALATAVSDGAPVGNATVYGFEAYVRWRVLQEALSDGRPPAERARLQRCFQQTLGRQLLNGPLASALAPEKSSKALASIPRAERPLRRAVSGCGELLSAMGSYGLFTSSQTQLTLGSGTDLFDEGDWQAGGLTSWQYIVSGSTLVGPSQLAQDRTAATGQGAGLYPGQLLTAPLAAYLSDTCGVSNRIDEYFLDNRVGRPDPRTFSDPRYYSDVLLEVQALEEG